LVFSLIIKDAYLALAGKINTNTAKIIKGNKMNLFEFKELI